MGQGIYTDFFGFSGRPFTLLPDPEAIFWSQQHQRAYSVLEYGIYTVAPLTIVTGEIGAGKTTLIQHLLSVLDENVTVGLISNATSGRGDLLRWVLYSLGIEEDANEDYISLFKRFQDFVVSEYARGLHVVLVIDEAQNLSIEALEELRMFTNINTSQDELLQLILVGQPELRDTIESPQLEQFAQRVAATYHIRPLNEEETRDYIRHRLVCVQGSGEEFSDSALHEIYKEAGGVPRLINKICDLSLVYASASGRKTVDDNTVRELIEDNLMIKPRASHRYVLKDPVSTPHGKAAE